MSDNPKAQAEPAKPQPGSDLRRVMQNSTLKMKTDGSMYENWVAWTGDAVEIDAKVKDIQARARTLSEAVDRAPEPVQAKMAGRMKAFGEQVTLLLKDEIAPEDRAKRLPKVKSALVSLGQLETTLAGAVEAHKTEQATQLQIAADRDLLADFTARAKVWRAKRIDPALGKTVLTILGQLDALTVPVLSGRAALSEKDRARFAPANLDKVGLAFDQAEAATANARAVAAERNRLGALLEQQIPADAKDAGVAGALPADVREVLAKRKDIATRIGASVEKPEDFAGIEDAIGTLPAMLDTVRDLVAERGRLGTLLDSVLTADAKPGDAVPGAGAGDMQAAMDQRKAVAAMLPRLSALAGAAEIEGAIGTLRGLLAGVGAVVQERARLTTLLDAALPADAAPEDIVPGATAEDVAGVKAERDAILTRIATPGVSLAALGPVAAEIAGLAPMIVGVGKAVAAARRERAKLQVERDSIAERAGRMPDTNPRGCSAAQIEALEDGRAAVKLALAAALTKDNNTAALAEVQTQEALLAATNEAVKQARKENDALVQPALRRLRDVENAFADLGIAAVWDLSAHSAYRPQIAAAQNAGDWPLAIQLADELAGKLDEPEGIAAEMNEFRQGGKLLQGTYDRILRRLADAGAFSLAAAKAEVKLIYDRQCDVTRLNWLEFLGVAGANVKVGDANGPHYTTFNNGVLQGAASASVTLSLDALCARLFETGIASTDQVHATVVDGADRFHKYWDGTYSGHYYARNVAGTNPRLDAKLTEWHKKLVDDMRKKVQQAKDAHGRIGTNVRGPEVV